MTSYFISSISIFTSRRRVQIQTASEMIPYFTMIKCNKSYFNRSTECLPILLSSISTISMMVVKTTLFNTRAQCSVKNKV